MHGCEGTAFLSWDKLCSSQPIPSLLERMASFPGPLCCQSRSAVAEFPHHVDKLIRNADDTTCTPKCFAGGGKVGGEGLAVSKEQKAKERLFSPALRSSP